MSDAFLFGLAAGRTIKEKTSPADSSASTCTNRLWIEKCFLDYPPALKKNSSLLNDWQRPLIFNSTLQALGSLM